MADKEKKSRLGKGVDALISNSNSKIKNENTVENYINIDKENINHVNINLVSPKKNQPRRNFNEDKLIELSESIKLHGILEPIIVSKKDNYYEIIAGERRWRAAKKAELKEVPVIVKDLNEREILELSLIENIQREDLNPIEEAMAYNELVNKFNMKQDEIAEKVSKSRTVITNSLRMLRLTEEVQKMVIDEKLSVGHARCLISIDDKEQQLMLANKIFDEGLTVRETESMIKKILNSEESSIKNKKEKKLKNQTVYDDAEKNLKNYLNTKVIINRKNDKKGKIEIEYYSEDELDRLMSLIIK